MTSTSKLPPDVSTPRVLELQPLPYGERPSFSAVPEGEFVFMCVTRRAANEAHAPDGASRLNVVMLACALSALLALAAVGAALTVFSVSMLEQIARLMHTAPEPVGYGLLTSLCCVLAVAMYFRVRGYTDHGVLS